jgi:ABC-type transport system involved in cytochrome c biogenesis permease subunit
MRPENYRNLWISMIFGAVPFRLDAKGQLHFKWCSFNTIYFLTVFAATSVYQV